MSYDPGTLASLMDVLGRLARECPLLFPVHPRTARVLAGIDVPPGLTLAGPLGYLDFIALEASAALVVTDSGGVQEETTMLGVPC